MIRTAMILGAGFGQRLRPLTHLRPKPMFPVLNKSMLEWWAETLLSAGLRRLVINVHHLAPLMLEHIDKLAASFSGRLEISACREERLLGTGGGIKGAEELLGKDDFLVVNSDVFTDFELVKLAVKQLANPGRLATLGLLESRSPANVGLGFGGRILGFRRQSPWPGEESRQGYSGVMALSPAIFQYLPKGPSDIVEVLQTAIGEGAEVFGWTYDPAIWRDMGSVRDYWELNRDLAAGRRIIHSSAVVEGELSGWNILGAGARVEEGGRVENCVLWPSAVVEAGAWARDALVCGRLKAGCSVEADLFCGEEEKA